MLNEDKINELIDKVESDFENGDIEFRESRGKINGEPEDKVHITDEYESLRIGIRGDGTLLLGRGRSSGSLNDEIWFVDEEKVKSLFWKIEKHKRSKFYEPRINSVINTNA